MCYYIGIEDLAANALISVMQRAETRFLSYPDIERYGNKVVELLNERGETAVLILSRDRTNALFRNYSDFFVESECGGQRGISLREDKSIDDLIRHFRGYLSLDLLLAFIDKRSIEVLGG